MHWNMRETDDVIFRCDESKILDACSPIIPVAEVGKDYKCYN